MLICTNFPRPSTDICLSTEAARETTLWSTWLRHFASHSLLPAFGRQLISRIHLSRSPSSAYIRAASSFPSNDPRLLGALSSTRLLLHDNAEEHCQEVTLDAVACRRYIALQLESGKDSVNHLHSLVEAVIDVVNCPPYRAFVKRTLRLMVASAEDGDSCCWLSVARIVSAMKGPRVKQTMEDVLREIDEILDAP